jgi:hypothetical protein
MYAGETAMLDAGVAGVRERISRSMGRIIVDTTPIIAIIADDDHGHHRDTSVDRGDRQEDRRRSS